jgi:CarboxypepD_reg-like domain
MMKLFIRHFLLLCLISFAVQTYAQQKAEPTQKDSVVQLYGVIMTADSLRGVPSASVIVLNKGRGTITNNDGIFSIVVLKGDRITFSSIGFKDVTIDIPKNLSTNELNIIQLLANTKIDDDYYEIARQNLDEQKRRALIANMPQDGREAVNYQLRQQASKYYYAGQLPPMNILNPAAWADFVKAWKRGDFKKKN